MSETPDVTYWLARWRDGDAQAFDRLVSLVYRELRVLAVRQFQAEGAGHTLQPTALVHEAYVKLLGQDPGRVENRVHFFALAAKAMRQVLVDHARRKAASKRAGDQQRVTLTNALDPAPGEDGVIDAIDLHTALERLATIQPRAAQVVELRYFGGLTLDQTAEIVGVTQKTVTRDWNTARLWLLDRLAPGR
ncbi:MAG: sigma-70 family RNA polymerase sigma factor [Acidobacteriota bacterium]